jgi:hypothetical protein
MATLKESERRLSILPVDAQSIILAFLSHGDLLCFSQISQGCRGVATMDCLWSRLQARHFGEVTRPN